MNSRTNILIIVEIRNVWYIYALYVVKWRVM